MLMLSPMVNYMRGRPYPFRLDCYLRQARSAALQLDSKARATRISAEISPRRAIASAVNTRWTCPFNACSRSVCINSPCFCHCLAQTRHSDVPIAHLIGSLEEYEYGEASSDCSRRG